jgi:hypothetical protein
VAKDFFLMSSSCHPDIPLELYITGVITAAPYKGTQEYEIAWGTSSIPIPFEKGFIRDKVVKSNLMRMAQL